ncbi:MAG: leucyl/phenylalanyl-tRNA--protein transferase [Verrucomicrobiia bacterium]
MPIVLNKNTAFPDPNQADAEGLVAIGGDFNTSRLLAAYRKGIFPWTVNPISWWSPDPRAIFELDHFHVPQSLARVIRQGRFEVTKDQSFQGVMEGCAKSTPERGNSWVTKEFIDAYTRLHRQGHAHSVECRFKGELVGGVYGVSIGGFFAGESMFHRVNDASKVALHHLVGHLRQRGFALFDIQMATPATKPLGAIEIPRRDYLQRLSAAVAMKCSF